MPKTNGSGQAQTLNPEQLDSLLDAAPDPTQRCLWAIMRFTGSRVTETLKLKWGALHQDRIVFIKSTTKTKTTREPLIGNRLQIELETYRAFWVAKFGREPTGRDLLFGGRYPNEPMSRQWADKKLRETIQEISLASGISLHSFRRSLATTMANSGVGLKTVCKFTGHRSLQQLSAYIDVSEANEREALAALN